MPRWAVLATVCCVLCAPATPCTDTHAPQVDGGVVVSCEGDGRVNTSLLETCGLLTATRLEFRGCHLPSAPYAELLRQLGVDPGNITSLSIVGTRGVEGVLDPDLLDGLNNLTALHIVDNNFTVIPRGFLAGVSQLNHLQVTGNQLGGLPDDLLTYTPRLQVLDVSANGLNSLSGNFFHNVTKLTHLNISYNELLDLQWNLFSNVTNIRLLDLSYNMFFNLSANIFNRNTQLRTLKLAGNSITNITQDIFLKMLNLEVLDFEGNLIHTLHKMCFSNQRKLKILNLSNNRLNELPDYLFQTCGGLEDLDLSHNYINIISDSQFPRPRTSLKRLVLSHNNFSFQSDFPLVSQIHLTDIILTNNSIYSFPWSFNRFILLKHIDLSRNKISFLDYDSFHFMENNVRVDLSHNQISLLDLSQMSLPEGKRVELLLEANPLRCNCMLYILAEKVQRKARLLEPHQTILHSPFQLLVCDAARVTCINDKNQTENLLEVDTKSLECQLGFLVGNCSCSWRSHDQMLCVDCSSQGLHQVPYPNINLANLDYRMTLNLWNNSITSLRGLDHPFYARLTNLTLANNKLQTLDESDLPRDLRVLDLRGNGLHALKSSMLKFLRTSDINLCLGNNSWRCECQDRGFLTFLKLSVQRSQVLDLDEVRCPGQVTPLHTWVESDLCSPFRSPKMVASLVAIVVLVPGLSAVVTCIFCKYRRHLQRIKTYQTWRTSSTSSASSAL